MVRTRVKICGITRGVDALAAAACGVDAIGLVFYSGSPRVVTLEQAREIVSVLPPFVTKVGLFVNESRERISAVVASGCVDLLQFHGQEDADSCDGFGLPYIKAIGMEDGIDLARRMDAYPDASGFLLDAWQPETHGGGGIGFDWNRIPVLGDRTIILAGGLHPGNVVEAIRKVGPYAVDVSSGVEIRKGVKSAEKIAAFLEGVNNCECE